MILVIEKIDIFIKNNYDQNAYLWLYNINNPIDFLLSKSGNW